jgi:hypothetical protein
VAQRQKPIAIVQWWLDKRNDPKRQLALARKNNNAREIARLQNGIKRIDVMLSDIAR